MRALPFIAAALAWSAIASAQLPDGGISMPRPHMMRSTGTPRIFNPKLGNRVLPPDKTLEFLSRPPPATTGPLVPAAKPRTEPPMPSSGVQVPAVAASAPATAPAFGNIAIPLPAAAPAPPPPRHKPRPRKPEPPPLPAPDLKLTIDAPSPEAPWTVRIENTGTIPLRIVADARLIALDITPADAKPNARPTKCELPGDMRPSDDDDRSLVLPPGRAFVDKIDPRLFCFGAHNAGALVAGSSVLPRLVGSRDLPVVAPIEEVEPVVATAHEWSGLTSTIGAPVVPSAKEATRARSLAISTPAFVDVSRAPEVAIPITTKNESNASIVFLLRPETVALDITGPSGIGVTDPSPTVHCAWSGPPPTPIRDLFAHVAPHGTDALSVLPSVLCPEGTLDYPGLYVVRARLDTRHASGVPIGLHTLDAEVAGETTTRLRVRETTGKAPAIAKPQLEVVPAH
jgi:hypothetical protein